jgi:hypothetical protein
VPRRREWIAPWRISPTLGELGEAKYVSISYEVFSELFPPGEPDDDARAACFEFANELKCRIERHPDMQEVWLFKDALEA